MSRHKLTKKINATFCKVKSRGSRTARTQNGYQFHHKNFLYLKLSYVYLLLFSFTLPAYRELQKYILLQPDTDTNQKAALVRLTQTYQHDQSSLHIRHG